MKEDSFLDKLAGQIIRDFGYNLNDVIIVLPNKRAKVFLLESLKKNISSTVFAPQIISIEDLIQEISVIRAIDPIEVLFEGLDLNLYNSDKYKIYPNPTSGKVSIHNLENMDLIIIYSYRKLVVL